MANLASARFLSACVTPGEMPEALSRIAEQGSGDGAVLVYSRHNVTIRVVASKTVTSFVSEYVGGNRPTDPRSHRVNPSLSEGFRLDQQDFSFREIGRNPFYQDFLRPRGLGWHACALLSSSPAGDAVHLSIKRSVQQGAFSAAELATLEADLPLMRAAVQFTQTATAMMGIATEALEVNGRHALFGFDSRGEAFWIVRTEGDATVVALRGGMVCCADTTEQAQLNAAVERARRGGQAAVMLTGELGFRWSFRIRRWPVDPEVNLALVAVLSRLDYVDEPSADWLATARDLFHFSQAEARVAALVGQGLSAPAIAQRLGISPGTVRNQIKAVFAKTSVSRQSELVVLLSRI